jgi:hypothetical protein
MQSQDSLIFSTERNLLVGEMSLDPLTMPLVNQPLLETSTEIVISELENNSKKLGNSKPTVNKNEPSENSYKLNRNSNYTQKDKFNGINQKTIVTQSMPSSSQKEEQELYEDVIKTDTRSLAPQSEKPTVYNQTQTLKGTEVKSDRNSDDLLVMQLKFDSNSGTQATDSSSSGKNKGELRNGATFKNVGAPYDNVVNFDGVDDYIQVKDSTSINQGTFAKRTISLRFKVDNKNISNRKQVLYEEGGAARGLNIYIYNGSLYVGGWNNPTSESNWKGTYLNTNAIASNKWHQVTLVLDAQADKKTLQAGAFKAYLDGKKFGTGEGSQLWNHADNIGIGSVNEMTQFHDKDTKGTGTNSLKGSIDDVRVYNRALSDKEISDLANLSPKPTDNSTDPDPDKSGTPIANADKIATEQDTKITVSAKDLLANDSDPDGNSLTIESVDNSTNGVVSLDSTGNVVFEPSKDFTGDASFEYTINDGTGGKATATVTVSVTTPETTPTLSNAYRIGTNLNDISDYSPQIPFIDIFKASRAWIPQSKSIWDTKEASSLDLDENGWVKSLPAEEDPAKYTSVATLMNHGLVGGRYQGGQYVVLYEGEGTLSYEWDAKKDVKASSPGRDVINVNPSKQGILMKLLETDPNNTGDYVRNIRVVPIQYENTYQSEIFNPEFIKRVKDFDSYRFMDWMNTNNSSQKEWSDRPKAEDARYSQYGVSVETMVKLANKTGNDPWFTMPHQATDEYVTNFASYVKENLNPNLKPYVEYTNEAWNGVFAQSNWIEKQSQGLVSYSNSNNNNGLVKRINGYSKRTTEIMQIWDEVYGADKEKVIGVMSAQAGNSYIAEQALSYDWTNQPKSNEEYGIDALAIAPYFGYYLGSAKYESALTDWTKQSDGGLNKLFDEITKGGVLKGGPKGGALQESFQAMQKHADIAEKEGLQLLAYEGGQHLAGIGGVGNNTAIVNLFVAANRDPRMGEIYQDYFKKWFEIGGDLFANFADITQPGKYGSWGVLESVYQTSSPKYDAVMNLIQSS